MANSETNKTISFEDFLQYDTEGKFDLVATVQVFSVEVEKYVVEKNLDKTKIAWAISEVYDARPETKYLLKPAVVAEALRSLGLDAFNPSYKNMEKKVHEYLLANEGKEKGDGKIYGIKRGPGGGMFRWADVA